MKEKFQPLKKVQLRGGFSDRNGVDKISTEIQLKDFDERTRNAFYNAIVNLIEYIEPTNHTSDYYEELLYKSIWKEAYCEILENDRYAYGYAIGQCKEYVKSTILSDKYDAVLTLIEYICAWTSDNINERNLNYQQFDGMCRAICFNEKGYFNEILEKEFVGYRFVGEHIVAITDDIEIKEIEQSLDIKFKGCKTQIQNALRLLSDRDKPDYKNSIKESISAVESICVIISKNPKATLGQAIKQLEDNGIKMHVALKNAYSSLYGYTSDEGGIRHAEGMFESDVTFEEAKFMLVSCCAFINYLIAEYGKIEE